LNSKSTFSNATSKSYALALYEISKENSSVDIVENEMHCLNKLLNESLDFKKTILSPLTTTGDKQNVLFKIAEQNNFSLPSKKFLGFVAKKNRLFFLQKIIKSFLNIVSHAKGELKARLVSSKELSTEEQKKIQGDFFKDLKSPLVIDYKYDPSLIGGLIIQIGSTMVDASIKTKLKKLETKMLEA
jgi:F-type H+-transporting ATPase subunit delta